VSDNYGAGMRIKMTGIHVDDPAQAFDVYTGVLGFEPVLAMPEANLFIVKSPQDPDGVALLLEPSDNPVASAYKGGLREAGIPVIVFGVPDVQAEYDRLTAAGVAFAGAPIAGPAGVTATFDDGCGNWVQLHQD
jgi:catechol 2,3-dioxygenase-like lactoylglutathione lyase family enzyme